MRRCSPLVMLGLVACSSAAPRSPAASSPSTAASTAASTAEVLARIRATPLAELAGAAGDLEVAAAEVEQVTAALWARYRAEVAADPARRAARAQQALTHGDVVMRYREETIGARPPEGYPLYLALHGGGGAPPALNDDQWAQMQRYYRASVDAGVYLAPRGVSDTWDLHFRPASYALYDRLIEDALVFADVDPDRVYLLGYSAGGDGVYQLAPRLTSRLAAASMSAGHPNGVGLDNLYHLPLAITVGELDDAYQRNTVAAEYCGRLAALAAAHPGGYRGACFVHLERPHNVPDNDPRATTYRVLAEPAAWLARGDRASRAVDTNAVRWLRTHRRSRRAATLRWDLATRAPVERVVNAVAGDLALLAPSQTFDWLAVEGDAPTTGVIEAHLDRDANAIAITGAPPTLRVRLGPDLVDLERELRLIIDGEPLVVTARPHLATLARTLLERGDPRLAFPVDLRLRRVDGGWQILFTPEA
jgi:hypothetical protein